MEFPYPFFTRMALDLAEEMGMKVEVVEKRAGYLLCLHYKGKKRYLLADVNPLNSHVASRIARDKAYTRMVLAWEGLPIPRGDFFFFPRRFRKYPYERGKGVREAFDFARELGYPLVVKPNTRSMGCGVELVRNQEELEEVLKTLERELPEEKLFLLEEHVVGREVRLILLDGEVLLALERTPFLVVGDGRKSVEDLAREAWQTLGLEKCHFPRERFQKVLKRKRMNWTEVLRKGDVLVLEEITWNLHRGGRAVYLEQVSSLWKNIAKRALEALGLRYGGVDLKIGEEVKILEVNSNAGFARFSRLGERERKIARSVFQKILEAIFLEK